MREKINLKGFSFWEKADLRINKKKYNFRTLRGFPGKEIDIKENIVLLGNHTGNVKVYPDCYLIFRGSLTGNLTLAATSKVAFFGELIGDVRAAGTFDFRKQMSIKGDIWAKALIVQMGAIFYGTAHLGKEYK